MNIKYMAKYIGVGLCAIGFFYGIRLFIEASQPCSSDGCMIHLLYIVAIPILVVTGIVGSMLIRSINRDGRGGSGVV